jgi:hypothetical protein
MTGGFLPVCLLAVLLSLSASAVAEPVDEEPDKSTDYSEETAEATEEVNTMTQPQQRYQYLLAGNFLIGTKMK